ncbi:hypothetical protein MNB_SV-5-139 [hydrothermal vent metagenome]|uniref:Uncharacterized protein n=1 Tax=hydrothermal vent metagenome TaxID=652676 RepID=A0A1W1ECI1_9ZZZZ
MLTTYFKEWGTGKLQRLPYIGYHFLLMALSFAIVLAALFAVGKLENVLGGDMMQTQQMLMDKFGFVSIIAFSIFVFSVMLAQINILGKRIRDIGLPALSTIFAIIALSMILNYIFPPELISVASTSIQTDTATASSIAANVKTNPIVQIFDAVIFLSLIFLPSNTFSKKAQ